MTYAQDIRSWESDQRRPPFWNVSGETIPAYAVMQVTGRRSGVTGGTILECSKPDGTGTVYAANGQFQVLDDKPGRCTLDWPAAVLATDTGEVGPVSGSWEMEESGGGWHTIGAITDGRTLVFGGLGSSSSLIWFIGTLSSDYLPGASGNIDVTPVSTIGFVEDISSFTSAENPFGCCGCSGDSILCVVDTLDSNTVRAVTVTHKLVKPLTTIVVNTSLNKLQGIRQPMCVMMCGPTEIFDIDDLEDCP